MSPSLDDRETDVATFQRELAASRQPVLRRVVVLEGPDAGKTFELDPNRAARLRAYVPSSFTYVAESGVRSIDDALRLRDSGADALLIGSYFMQAEQPGEALRELVMAL